MRPLRLRLQGFSSFRDPVEIDFEGVEYFALVGPTGSGKSSVIDGMCFALYGTIPRLDDRRKVAPVITQGQLEAKVSLDFIVDEKTYTATRVVRRNPKGGASTKEARLELDGEVLAGNPDEITAKVTELIGLSFEHFTRCVVLPQGEFSRFLHDQPKDRQGMLVKLLNFQIYDQMRRAAVNRSDRANTKLEASKVRLSDLAFATKDALDVAKVRVKQLDALHKKVKGAEPELAKIEERLSRARVARDEAKGWIEKLQGLEIPSDMGELADQIAHAKKSFEEADQELAAIGTKVGALQDRIESLPEKAPLQTALLTHDRRATLASKQTSARKAVAATAKDQDRATSSLTKAEAAHKQATEADLDAKDEHAALHLAKRLVPGEPCPVCLQEVKKKAKHPSAANLVATDKALQAAGSSVVAARDEVSLAAVASKQAETELGSIVEQLTDAGADLKGFEDRQEVAKRVAEIGKVEVELKTVRAGEKDARDRVKHARSLVTDLNKEEEAARTRLNLQRDELGALGPPAMKGKDLANDWEALVSWAAAHVPGLEKKAITTEQKAAAANAERADIVEVLAGACVECAIDLKEADDINDVVVRERASAVHEVERIDKAIKEAASIEATTKSLAIEAKVAHELGLHLKSDRFERWLVNEALRRLTTGASEVLASLSGDQYSLAIDDLGNFLVTDHHNVNESRSARTLSGGETFLASLSLALSLSDQLMELATHGSARLDAIFLDEGFGTLDQEALGTVAATVDTLAFSGRMVGVITHVRELAEKIPVRFNVRKEGRTSLIEKEEI